jgi:hypothetical protein
MNEQALATMAKVGEVESLRVAAELMTPEFKSALIEEESLDVEGWTKVAVYTLLRRRAAVCHAMVEKLESGDTEGRDELADEGMAGDVAMANLGSDYAGVLLELASRQAGESIAEQAEEYLKGYL